MKSSQAIALSVMRETRLAGSNLSVKQSEVLFLSQFMLGGSVKLLFGHNAGQR